MRQITDVRPSRRATTHVTNTSCGVVGPYLATIHPKQTHQTTTMNMRSALLVLLAVPVADAFVAPRHSASRSAAAAVGAPIGHQLPMVSMEPAQRSLLVMNAAALDEMIVMKISILPVIG